jgi:hypothetical protein
MPDVVLDRPRLLEALRAAHATDLVVWDTSEGLRIYCVLAQTDPGDLYCEHLIQRGTKARREPWQRKNIILAIGGELERVCWSAKHCPLPDLGVHQTLWYERATRQYRIGPYHCERNAGTGRPSWAIMPT